MIRGTVDRRDLVCTCRKTVGHIGGEDAVNSCVVQAFEERELIRIGRRRL